MKKIHRIGIKILMIWLPIYIIGNTYFGWNEKPQSELELMFDTLIIWISNIGMTFYFLPIFRIYESAVKKLK